MCNVRVTAAIARKLSTVARGRDVGLSVRLIFQYRGGDVRCEGGVISAAELDRGFKKVASYFSARPQHETAVALSLSQMRLRRPPPPQLHTLIAKGFDRLASSNISELKQIKIMLVGMVNAGKSSFLNVLLGLDKEIHFPTNESSWTRIITKLKYGPTKKWCLRTTDEKERCVTEQCDFDGNRILNALCAYGRNKYYSRPEWLQQWPKDVGDDILAKLTDGDDDAKRKIQETYSVSDLDMDITMQWANGDTHVSVEDAEALADVCLRRDFRDKFLLKRRACPCLWLYLWLYLWLAL